MTQKIRLRALLYIPTDWIFPSTLNKCWASLIMIKYALSQVLEYHPAPWDKCLTVGNLQIKREKAGVASIGTQDLPCLSGED